MKSRNHHYISQAYLSGFANRKGKNEQVMVFDRKEARTFATNVRNVGSQRDFNRIESDEENPNFLEDTLGEFEGKIKPVVQSVSASGSPTEEEYSVLLTMIALYAVRTPSMRTHIANEGEKLKKFMLRHIFSNEAYARAQLKKFEEEHKVSFDKAEYQDLRKLVESGEYSVKDSQERLIDLEMQQLLPMVEMLSKRQWSFLVSDEDAGPFITSDRPVILRWYNANEVPPIMRGSPGFGLRGTILYFPLCMQCAMLGSFDGIIETSNSKREKIAHFNAEIVNGSFARVFFHPNGFHFMNQGMILEQGELSRIVKAKR